MIPVFQTILADPERADGHNAEGIAGNCYTLKAESGASLRAAGWSVVAERAPRKGWDTPTRRRLPKGADNVARYLWEASRRDQHQRTVITDPARIRAIRNQEDQ